MPSFLLSAETNFSAAHTLPGVDMCERFHGHNWNVRLTVRVEEGALDSLGMGVDFRDIEQTVRSAVEDFEHRYLNDLEAFSKALPTAENVARIVFGRAVRALEERGSAATVAEVEIWETDKYRVVYRAG